MRASRKVHFIAEWKALLDWVGTVLSIHHEDRGAPRQRGAKDGEQILN